MKNVIKFGFIWIQKWIETCYMTLIEYLQNILVSKLILACFCYLQLYSAKRLNNVNKQH